MNTTITPEHRAAAEAARQRLIKQADYNSHNVYAEAFRRLEEKILVARVCNAWERREAGWQV